MTAQQREKIARWYEAESERMAKKSGKPFPQLKEFAKGVRENDPAVMAMVQQILPDMGEEWSDDAR